MAPLEGEPFGIEHLYKYIFNNLTILEVSL